MEFILYILGHWEPYKDFEQRNDMVKAVLKEINLPAVFKL